MTRRYRWERQRRAALAAMDPRDPEFSEDDSDDFDPEPEVDDDFDGYHANKALDLYERELDARATQ